MEIAGEQSPNDFSFSVKTQTKSAFEILVPVPRRVGRLCLQLRRPQKMVSWLIGVIRTMRKGLLFIEVGSQRVYPPGPMLSARPVRPKASALYFDKQLPSHQHHGGER
jgi:hypothetical protein